MAIFRSIPTWIWVVTIVVLVGLLFKDQVVDLVDALVEQLSVVL